jgi:hypothetical protein
VLKTHEENIHIVTEWITNDGKLSYPLAGLTWDLSLIENTASASLVFES